MATKDDELAWLITNVRIDRLLEEESARPKCFSTSNVSICMVPDTLRSLNPAAYTPKVFSIGPLHKDDDGLKAMEKHKVTYMHQLFHRYVEFTREMELQTTQECVKAVFGLVTKAKACYAPSFTKYEDHKFAEMMVIDGCFILELLYRFKHGIAEGDPVFDNMLTLQEVKSDLLLLENQIPLFILEVLFHILTVKQILTSTSLHNLILYFFTDMNILNDVELCITDDKVERFHILGLLQSCYRPKATNQGKIPVSFSATEIAGAGVTFKASRDKKFLLAVIFEQLPHHVPWLGTLIVRDTSDGK